MCSNNASAGWFLTPVKSGPTCPPSPAYEWHTPQWVWNTADPAFASAGFSRIALYSSYTAIRSPPSNSPNSFSAFSWVSVSLDFINRVRSADGISAAATVPFSIAEKSTLVNDLLDTKAEITAGFTFGENADHFSFSVNSSAPRG